MLSRCSWWFHYWMSSKSKGWAWWMPVHFHKSMKSFDLIAVEFIVWDAMISMKTPPSVIQLKPCHPWQSIDIIWCNGTGIFAAAVISYLECCWEKIYKIPAQERICRSTAMDYITLLYQYRCIRGGQIKNDCTWYIHFMYFSYVTLHLKFYCIMI